MTPKGTVLIVDDSAADRALFRTILTRGGYSVFEASRGQAALEHAKAMLPHLVVLDVNLPDIDGFEVCRALRNDSTVANTPVLMLTVRHDDRDVLAGLEAGADDYVAKDSAPELVLARVCRLIHYRQLLGLSMLNRQLVQVGRLLAGIVHEIRGPLSVIRGCAELLKLGVGRSGDNLQLADSILRGSELLQLRLDHLMATVRTGPPQLKEVEIDPILSEAAELFIKGLPPDYRRFRVESQFTTPGVRVRADGGRLIHVLIDLLTNAHQAVADSGASGRALIRTCLEVPEGDSSPWIRIDVIDDGPGIQEIYLGRIFEPFFTTKEGGTGYGLYLASELLKEQGGRLAATNNHDGGARFTVWLPLVNSGRDNGPRS